MTNTQYSDEVMTEAETDDTPFIEFELNISPSDPPLEFLAQQIERGDIVIPFYQRRYVWSIEQASKLIESFLMGVPVPQVFFYVNDEDRLEVIDGQQRLLSIKYFIEGYFGQEDTKESRRIFKLKKLAERSEYNEKTFADLSPKDQRRFRNATLRAINIKQLKPIKNNDIVYHIFERLNTGGIRLRPQEIRNAVYRGKIVSELKSLNDISGWRKILGLDHPDKNQRDVELLLRLFTLYGSWQSYEKPMLTYLNRGMRAERDFSSSRSAQFTKRFPQVVDLVNQTLSDPFRPRRVINAAILEAVMVTLLENTAMTSQMLRTNYKRLLEDEKFLSASSGATTDTAVLKARLARAASILSDG